jgi:hypothetical protein
MQTFYLICKRIPPKKDEMKADMILSGESCWRPLKKIPILDDLQDKAPDRVP